MPSKKKPRPLFEVPVEIGSGRESGWVYRSDAETGKETARETARETEEPSVPFPQPTGGATVGAQSAHLFALAVATVAQSFVVAFTIAALPMTLGIRAMQSLTGPDESR